MEPKKVQVEFAQALEALRVAWLFQDDGWHEDVVWWAYSAVSHATKAALLLHERRVKTHAALRRALSVVLVRTGHIEQEWVRVLRRIQDRRIGLTVNASGPLFLAAAGSLPVVVDAARFVERIRKYLHDEQRNRR